MKKYKEEAYKGYMKFVKENKQQKIASITWLGEKSLRVEIEAPYMISNKSKGNPPYFFCPKATCVIDFHHKERLDYAKQVVYSALWRMNKELDEIGEKVEGK